jgi:hypothetical protein
LPDEVRDASLLTRLQWSVTRRPVILPNAAAIFIDGKLEAPAGLAIGPDDDLYVAEGRDQRIRRFSVKGKSKKTFIDRLPYIPKFLVHVPD